MREYRLYTINYMIDLNTRTNNYEDMKKRIDQIRELVKTSRKSEVFFEGAYIEILEDGKVVDTMSWYKFE